MTGAHLFDARSCPAMGRGRPYRIFHDGRTLYFVCLGGHRLFRSGGMIDLLLSVTAALCRRFDPTMGQTLDQKIYQWSSGVDQTRLAGGLDSHQMVTRFPHSFALDAGQMVDMALTRKQSQFRFGFHFAMWTFTDAHGQRWRFMLETEEQFCYAFQSLLTLFGQRLQRDKAMATRELDPVFQYTLGYYFQQARHDYALALHWLTLAAQQNIIPAQYHLGRLYEEGTGVSRDAATAAHWYTLAAHFEDMDAQVALARLYETGLGVTRDLAQAAHWYRQAAEQGFPEGQYHLARFHELGLGMDQDATAALQLYAKAAQYDHPLAREAVARLQIAHPGGRS